MNAARADRRTEAERIEAALKAVPWPPFVKEREWNRGWDWVGDEGLWIWVVVSDFKEIEAYPPSWSDLPQAIREALSAEGLDLRVYLRVKEVIEPPRQAVATKGTKKRR